uniref:Cytochrome P450 family 26 subfamily C member 1 n=1 Tax=Pseudonaja textilis TaxID=8673 RepID=A0A670YJX1_PSETE
WLEAALVAAAAAGLLLVAARHLWALRWRLSRDRTSALPLPRGSMGWPFLGETLHWLIQVSTRQRQRCLGRGGGGNPRGWEFLPFTRWAASLPVLCLSLSLRTQILARVFSHAALEVYLPPIQRLVSWELRGWRHHPGPIAVYASAKALTFRIAVRILLGLRLEEEPFEELSRAFEQLVENLFSLPLNVPFSGLRKGIKARDLLHTYMEKAILEKLQRKDPDAHRDALDFIINSAKEHGQDFTMQELKESAIELIFAAFFTTASATTSMILLLLKHPLVIKKIQLELASNGLTGSEYCCHPYLTLEKLNSLRYLDCVIKEVLRLLPPVSGGYRTALQTFELDGYQIPKGWSVMYSIRDTHETASIYQSPPDTFDPERFWVSLEDQEENKTSASLRFHYIPFGGGVRNCIGKELAKAILKMLAVELVSTASWELATAHFPKMQTVPIVHPVDDLQVYFHSLKAGHESSSGTGKVNA